MQCERCGGLVTWRGPMAALTHTECEQCGGINCQLYEPTQEELAVFEAEAQADAEAYRKPPCLECGAMTLEEARERCICNGDKDDCHGLKLWPD